MYVMDLAIGYMRRGGANRQRGNILKLLAAASVILLATLLANPAHARYAAIVIDADTGRVLHSRNADTPNFPASLTKMMTLYMTFEALEQGRLTLNQRLRVSKRAAGQPASKLGLKERDTITVEDAIRAMSVKSANDVATVVAEAIGGTEIKFAQMMTKRARQLGMTRTSFRNASGLPNRRQKSTARDMSILAMALLNKFPHYYGYFSEKSFRYKGKNYRNHNSLLKHYAGTDGIKTGYIRASGFNLVASAERDGVRLIGVVFGGKTADRRDRQMQSLLNRSWAVAHATSTIAARPVPKPELPSEEPVAAPLVASAPIAKPQPPTISPVNVIAARINKPKPPTIVVPPTTVSSTRIDTPVTVSALGKPRADWGIQIGAFEGYANAHRAAGNVARRLSDLPPTTSLKIQPVSQKADTLFRARLMGMDEASARATCRQLLSNGQVCVLVTPQGNEIASLTQ